jgi:hypothetical protein
VILYRNVHHFFLMKYYLNHFICRYYPLSVASTSNMYMFKITVSRITVCLKHLFSCFGEIFLLLPIIIHGLARHSVTTCLHLLFAFLKPIICHVSIYSDTTLCFFLQTRQIPAEMTSISRLGFLFFYNRPDFLL